MISDYSQVFFFNTIFVSSHNYVPREPRRDPSNPRLNELGIYIQHCQESNSQPVDVVRQLDDMVVEIS